MIKCSLKVQDFPIELGVLRFPALASFKRPAAWYRIVAALSRGGKVTSF
jgi:hypothetical protein